MFSKFKIASRPVSFYKSPKFVVDQFQSTEFFRDNGQELRDYTVYARSASDPELREKVKTYMIENEISSANSDLTDDQVFNQIQSKYDSLTNILDRVKTRISELRSKSVETPEPKSE